MPVTRTWFVTLFAAFMAISVCAQDNASGGFQPLTSELGNPGRGRRIVVDAENVTCLICHVLPLPDEPDMGAIGPSLIGVGDRLTEAELRQRLVDPKGLNPETIMPSYYQVDGLYSVAETYRGRTIYTAQEIEDVVAYLASLKEPK